MVKKKCLIGVVPSDSLTAVDKVMVEEKREMAKLMHPASAADKANITRTIEARMTQQEQSGTIVGLVSEKQNEQVTSFVFARALFPWNLDDGRQGGTHHDTIF